MPGISSPPRAGSIWNGLPLARTYHAPPPSPGLAALKGLRLGCTRDKSPVGDSQAALAILTKKSKLKRKRKYLVTLTQADPILRPWSSLWREEAGRSA